MIDRVKGHIQHYQYPENENRILYLLEDSQVYQ